MSKTNNNIIGIDVGGSKIRGIIWSGKKIIVAHETQTPKNKNRFTAVIKKISAQLVHRGKTNAIGIGVAGIVEHNKIRSATNIRYLKQYTFIPHMPKKAYFQVDNDARCFARAEFLLGAGRGTKRMLAITIGTGIGRALAEGGAVWRIKKFEREERWEKTYQKLRDTHDTQLSKFLAEKLMSIVRRHKPTAIVIGGSMEAKRGFFETLKKEFRVLGCKATMHRSKLGKNGGAIGAALLWNNS